MKQDNCAMLDTAQAIVDKFASVGIQLKLQDIIVGATVTRYVFDVLSPQTRMSEFRKYVDDIMYCAQTCQDVMIEAPLDGQAAIGIDIPNKERRLVLLNDLLERPEYKNASGDLVFAIGEEVTGKAVVADLTKLPHVLVAGTTGSGKTVVLNNLIISLAHRYSPDYVRFVLFDPKYVELSRYNGLPHMLTREAVTSVRDALAAMDYLIDEMERRYNLFRQDHVACIRDYNKAAEAKSQPRLPYLVFVVDELADMMAVSKSEFETKLMRLAQKARAAGIHIVLATQRTDIKVITGTVRANIPCRIALKVFSAYDSQTVINRAGAEKLIGMGDMLLDWSSSDDYKRVQGAYISNSEVGLFLENAKQKYAASFDPAVSDAIFVLRRLPDTEEHSPDNQLDDVNALDKELFFDCKKALRYWLEHNDGKASMASLQRGIGVGFTRAGRIMDALQRAGYVETPTEDVYKYRSPLKVLVKLDELDDLFPDED